MKKLAFFLALVLTTSTLIGCNTMSGVGEDLESLGGAIKNSADKDK